MFKTLQTTVSGINQYAKGNSLYNSGKYKEALEVYDEIIKLDQDTFDGHKSRAMTLHKLKRYKDALVEYNEALRIKPNHVNVLTNKAAALHMMEMYRSALDVYEEVRKLKPDYKLAYKNTILAIKMYSTKHRKTKCNVSNRDDPQVLPEFHIYKSYSPKDSNIVNPFIELLSFTYGLHISSDSNLRFERLSENWWDEIGDSIKESKLVICFISNNFMQSQKCRKELNFAINNNKQVFIIMLEDTKTESITDEMQVFKMFENKDLRKKFWSGDMFRRLLKSISNATEFPIPL